MFKFSIIFLIIIVNYLNSGLVSKAQAQQQRYAPEIKMSDGRTIPSVGLGTWLLGNDTEVKRATLDSIDCGYRLIDTASLYNTEKGIGMAVNEAIASNRMKRENIFITSKVWNNMHSRASVLKSIRQSLETLNLQYIDLFLIHYPTGFKEGPDLRPTFENGTIIPINWEKDAYLETWKGMEDAYNLGLTKSIGVSNFNSYQLRKVMDMAVIKPVVNQVECHPYWNEQKLLEFCKRNNIVFEAYAPLRRADPELLNDPVLVEIAAKHSKSTAQVSLRWLIQKGAVVIPKTTKKSRMIENMNIFDFDISDADMKKIDGMKQKPKYYDTPGIRTHPDYPFKDVEYDDYGNVISAGNAHPFSEFLMLLFLLKTIYLSFFCC